MIKATAKVKTCARCAACKRLYGEYAFRFYRYHEYYCEANDAIIASDGYCEKWSKRKTVYDISPQRFDEAENDIRFIIEYFDTSD